MKTKTYIAKLFSAMHYPVEITMHEYESLEDLISMQYQEAIEELEKYEHGGVTLEGVEIKFSFATMMDSLRETGCYGMADPNNNSIHYWADRSKVTMQNLIGLFSHEAAHLKETPVHFDFALEDHNIIEQDVEEEIKAERYSDIAIFAFDLALKIMKGKIPFKI